MKVTLRSVNATKASKRFVVERKPRVEVPVTISRKRRVTRAGANDPASLSDLAPLGGRRGEPRLLAFAPDGSGASSFANGLAVQPQTGDLWCSTNKRDRLGDDLPPDFVTRVREGAFYGWPWYSIGAHQDPRHRGEPPQSLRGPKAPRRSPRARSRS